jgi:hypothetical protein
MIDQVELAERIGNLEDRLDLTERERIEVAAMVRAYLKMQEYFTPLPRDAVAALVERLRTSQHVTVCKQAAEMIELLDRISTALARQLSQSIARNAKDA